jgi:hypothetical protein
MPFVRPRSQPIYTVHVKSLVDLAYPTDI